jgi:hypothetical protein
MSAPSPSSAPSNRRPTEVGALLHEGELFPGWFTVNKKSNRFYLVNLGTVMDALAVEYTKMDAALSLARDVIHNDTDWYSKYPFEYKAATLQLNPRKMYEPKLFGHAVAIIVSLEMDAKAKKIDFNVYDHLRIIAAQYFVDHFDRVRYEELTHEFASWSITDRIKVFGPFGNSRNFEELCLAHMGQVMSPELTKLMSFGYTSTKYCCEKLVEVVSKFPRNLHVGPVLSSGQPASSNKLGVRNAANTLRVPREIAPHLLSPCL